MTSPTATAAARPLFDTDTGLTPETVADIFKRAAQVITSAGHTSWPGYEGETGFDIETAVKVAAEERIRDSYAREPMRGEVRDIVEGDLMPRLSGLLYVAGQVRSNQPVFGVDGVVSTWEDRSPKVTAADVAGFLNTAALAVLLVIAK